jgi:uncharacterized protein (UPF0335 family)
LDRYLGLTPLVRSRKGRGGSRSTKGSERNHDPGRRHRWRAAAHVHRADRASGGEKKDVQEQIKDVFSEAKGVGFDTRIMRQRLRRLRDADRSEQEELLEIYKTAIGMR